MIMRAMEPSLHWSELKEILVEMLDALDVFDCQHARELLMRTVTEYRPATAIQDLVWLESQQAEREHPNVAVLRPIHSRPRRTVAAVSPVST